MKSILVIIISIYMMLASSSVGGSSYPPLFAIDIKDGNGLQIFRKQPSANNCLIYRSIEQNSLTLLFSYGEWSILYRTTVILTRSGNCFVNGGKGNILFLQEGESLSSEGWFDVQKNISNVNFVVYALEECSIYRGAYVDADFSNNLVLPNGNISSCRESLTAFDGEWSKLFTTTTAVDMERRIYCRYDDPDILTRGNMLLSGDENATILIDNQNCNKTPSIMDISEALLHNNGSADLSYAKEESNLAIPVTITLVSILLLSLMVVGIICCCCCDHDLNRIISLKNRKIHSEAMEIKRPDSNLRLDNYDFRKYSFDQEEGRMYNFYYGNGGEENHYDQRAY